MVSDDLSEFEKAVFFQTMAHDIQNELYLTELSLGRRQGVDKALVMEGLKKIDLLTTLVLSDRLAEDCLRRLEVGRYFEEFCTLIASAASPDDYKIGVELCGDGAGNLIPKGRDFFLKAGKPPCFLKKRENAVSRFLRVC